MKTQIDLNSVEAYHSIKEELPKRRKAVLEIIYLYRSHGITSFQIAEALNLTINQITGRINELMHMQVVRIRGKRTWEGKSRNLYTIRWATDPKNVFPVTLDDAGQKFIQDLYDSLPEKTAIRNIAKKHGVQLEFLPEERWEDESQYKLFPESNLSDALTEI